MNSAVKKSVLCDLMSRHSNFDFEQHMTTKSADEFDMWNGFCLPFHYSDEVVEYQTLRNSCAIFDASPMKKYRITGADAGKFLDRILTAPVSQTPNMKASYGLICDEAGFLIDDGIVNKFADDDYLFLITELDLDDHFAKYNDFDDVIIVDETELLAGVAIQGPKSCQVLQQFGFTDIEKLAPFELAYVQLSGHKILVGRLGFTGDLGYEIWFSPEAIDSVTQAFEQAEANLNIKLLGYGLTVVNICRIEAGMIVPGWDTAGTFEDINNERTPFELTLGWNVKLNSEHDFVGKDALKQIKAQGTRYRMRGIRISEHCSLEEGQVLYAIVDGQTIKIGKLPSIVWHESKSSWIGYASMTADCASIEDVFVICNKTHTPISGTICQIPFINLPHRSQVPVI